MKSHTSLSIVGLCLVTGGVAAFERLNQIRTPTALAQTIQVAALIGAAAGAALVIVMAIVADRRSTRFTPGLFTGPAPKFPRRPF